MLGRNEIAVDFGRIGIEHHDVGSNFPAIFEANPRGLIISNKQLIDLLVEFQFYAFFLHELDQSLNQGTRTSSWEPDTPLSFKIMNEAVYGGGLERVTPNQQWVNTESTPKTIIFQKLGYQGIDGEIAF